MDHYNFCATTIMYTSFQDNAVFINKQSMKQVERPLTKRMIEQLRRAREIDASETGRKSFLTIDDFKNSMPGLYMRGLLDTKMITSEGKRPMQIYITEAGKNILRKYAEGENKFVRALEKLLQNNSVA